MGLDWQLIAPAKPGKTTALRALRKKLEKMQANDGNQNEIDRVAEGLEALEVSPLDFLDTPRIGIDESATEWLRARWKAGHYKPHTWKALVQRCHGEAVLALAQPKAGLPIAQGMFAGGLDFRGQQLGFAEAIIGEELVSEAWNNHTAAEMVDYAARLQTKLDASRAKRGRVSPETKDTQALIEGAIEWLHFWGSHGFSYHAWF